MGIDLKTKFGWQIEEVGALAVGHWLAVGTPLSILSYLNIGENKWEYDPLQMS
jgi:hypothetical protein